MLNSEKIFEHRTVYGAHESTRKNILVYVAGALERIQNQDNDVRLLLTMVDIQFDPDNMELGFYFSWQPWGQHHISEMTSKVIKHLNARIRAFDAVIQHYTRYIPFYLSRIRRKARRYENGEETTPFNMLFMSPVEPSAVAGYHHRAQAIAPHVVDFALAYMNDGLELTGTNWRCTRWDDLPTTTSKHRVQIAPLGLLTLIYTNAVEAYRDPAWALFTGLLEIQEPVTIEEPSFVLYGERGIYQANVERVRASINYKVKWTNLATSLVSGKTPGPSSGGPTTIK
jgi:hypothetical protein